MKPTIVFYDVHPSEQATYESALASDFELVFCEAGFTADTANLAGSAAVISVHVSSKVTASLMEKLPKLHHIACRSTGYDNVDLTYTKTHAITVSNVPAYGQETVAEYTILLMLAVSRKLMLGVQSVQSGAITPETLTGHDLSGKTLGVIGTGRIGQHVIQIARGFGMKIVAYDLYPQAEAATRLNFKYLELNDLLSQADIITLHAPATPETEHLLGTDQFEHIKPGVIVINTARGSLIDTPALIEALGSGKVAGAGLDVLEGEEYLQLAPEISLLSSQSLGEKAQQILGLDILQKMRNVLITSHNAYNSAEALERIRQTAIQNIISWHAEKLQNEVKS